MHCIVIYMISFLSKMIFFFFKHLSFRVQEQVSPTLKLYIGPEKISSSVMAGCAAFGARWVVMQSSNFIRSVKCRSLGMIHYFLLFVFTLRYSH